MTKLKLLLLLLLPTLLMATAEPLEWSEQEYALSPEPSGDEVTLTLPRPGDEIGYETVTRPRMIEVSTGLVILVDDFAMAVTAAQEALSPEQGFISQLTYVRPLEDPASGRLLFQVRTDERDGLIRKLTALGDVISEERNSEDVSEEFYREQRELEELKATMTALRRELIETTSERERKNLERDLLEAENKAANLLLANPQLDGEVGLTSLFLTLTEDSGFIGDPGERLLGKGVSEGYIALMHVVRVLIIILMVGLPVGALAFLILILIRRYLRKRKTRKVTN
ncbi:DUF4349 domain-containing protein [bacterium]|nr:DUF4349 domain-containing protein [bacterium]